MTDKTTCPACGAKTAPIRGHRTLCFACTLDELGVTWDEIKDRTRVSERKAAKALAGGRADAARLS